MFIRNAVKKITIGLLATSLIFTSCAKKIDENTSASEQDTTVPETTTVAKELKPAFGGVLELAMNKPATLNILKNQIRDVADVLSLVYEPLFVLGADEKPVPVLAKSYEYDESGRGLTITLRDDVFFHNGEPLTAADVKYTIDYIKTNPESPYNFYALPIKRVSIVDDFIVKFYYDEPYAYALSDLIFPIVSADYFISGDYDENKPVGTGPYAFKDFKSTSYLDLTYFDKYRDKCYIENIRANIVNSSDEIENMFNAGLIDIYAPMVFNWLDYSDERGDRVVEYPSRNLTFIGFNFKEKEILTEDVRVNIMRAIDRKDIAYKLFVDRVKLSNTPVIYGAYFNSDDGIGDKFNEPVEPVASAEKPLKLKMLVNSSSQNNVKLAEAIANALKAQNIEIENVLLEKEAYFISLNAGNFDLYLANLRLSSRPDYYSLLNSEGTQNFGKYSNPIMDEYIEKLIISTGEEAIVQGVNDIETQFLADLPYATLFFHDGGVLLSKKVKGNYTVYKDNILYGVRELYINEE